MTILWSFLIGGIVTLIGQLVAETKLPPPWIVVIFIVLGGVLTPFGVTDKLFALGQGANADAIGPGSAGTGTMLQWLGTGSPLPFIYVAVLMFVLIVLGAVAGYIRYEKFIKIREVNMFTIDGRGVE
jgi:hypothetical protein